MRRRFFGAADGPWLDMVLINGFTAGATPPQYMKDSRGGVHLRGLVVCPGGQAVGWDIPVGYRPLIDPASNIYVDYVSGGSDLVNPGRLTVITATTVWIGLTSTVAAGAVGAIAGLDRVCWQA